MQEKAMANIKIGTGIMEAFTRMPVDTDQLLREFIDNSTTSYYDHAATLDKVVEQQKCIVTVEWDDSKIVIEDNAFGMNKEEFLRALRPNAKAEKYSEESRGKYGLGLKYAALNLGSVYTIETTAYNSDKQYFATIDLEELKADIEEVEYTISDAIPTKHFTRITITKLARTIREKPKKKGKKVVQTKEETLIEAISRIYKFDITEGKLDIYFNGKKIKYLEPELLQRKDGGEFISSFDDSFDFGGKRYDYSGWIAILNKADISNAGFTLVQKDRAIQLNYRPEELFGKSNDFRYQRVIGEINLIGDSWIVTFTKNAIKWDDFGLEDTFIQSIKDNNEILSIFKYAKEYRKRKENVTPENLKSWEKDFEKTFGKPKPPIEEEKTKEVLPLTEEKEKNEELTPQDKDNKPNNIEEKKEENSESVTFPVPYGGINYEFEIIPAIDASSDVPWINVQSKDAQNNKFRIELNARTPFFEEYTDQKSKKLITKMALCVVLAQLASKKAGLSAVESQKFVEELNAILASSGKDE